MLHVATLTMKLLRGKLTLVWDLKAFVAHSKFSIRMGRRSAVFRIFVRWSTIHRDILLRFFLASHGKARQDKTQVPENEELVRLWIH